MSLKDYEERQALALKYGWSIAGWAVDLDNEAGISLWSRYGKEHLRFQHSDSLAHWEKVLKANDRSKVKAPKKKKVAAKKKRLKAAPKRLTKKRR
jgi:hypothetical protein